MGERVICANHCNQGNWYHRGNKCQFPFGAIHLLKLSWSVCFVAMVTSDCALWINWMQFFFREDESFISTANWTKTQHWFLILNMQKQNQQLAIFGSDQSIFTPFLCCHQYSGGIPWGTDSYRFLYILNCFAALSNVSTLIVHRETFHFLHHKTRKSSEISLSRLRSNFRPISADISLKLVQTWQLTGPFPPARHLRINEVWHHG